MDFKIKSITSDDLEDVLNFLKIDEEMSIGLMSQFVNGGKTKMLDNHLSGFLVLCEDGQKDGVAVLSDGLSDDLCDSEHDLCEDKIVAVFTLSKSGVILHHFSKGIIDSSKDELKKVFLPIFRNKKIYAIIGEKKGTEFIKDVISGFCNVRHQVEYTLMHFSLQSTAMHHNVQNCSEPHGTAMHHNALKELPDNIVLHSCTKDDTEKLFCLQAKYELVEVLPPYEKFNSDLCRLNLRHNLSIQYILALEDTSTKKYIAKAGTNAIGLNWVQLGGVFTEEDYRKKGFASFLVKKIALYMAKNNKKTALFVKINNEPAKNAYSNAGFLPVCDWLICYY